MQASEKHRRLPWASLTILGALTEHARAEESSVLDDATVSSTEIITNHSAGANALIDGCFKSLQHSDYSNNNAGSKEFGIKLSQPTTLMSAFVGNRADQQSHQKRMGSSAIYIGDDSAHLSASLTKCTSDFFDTTFQNFATPCTGSVVALRRTGLPSSNHSVYNINEVRLYQTPNLMQELNGVLSISAPPPKAAEWSVDNLVQNLATRTSGNNLRPLIDSSGATGNSIRSCYKTTNTQLSSEGDELTITVDLKQSKFIHAVLAVQDLYNGTHYPSDHTNTNEWLQNLRIYIGDYADYLQNAECPGGPFMVVGDTANSYTEVFEDGNSQGNMWNYGVEAWCNQPGRYVTLVANLSTLSGQVYEMALCHLGLFGTEYVRDTPVPASLSVNQAEEQSISVQNIYSAYPIGNTLDVKLRQKPGTELPWVTITQGSPSVVKLSPVGVSPGTYTLTLESFDDNGTVKSALYTDTITLTVTGFTRGTPIPSLFEVNPADPQPLSIENIQPESPANLRIHLRQKPGTELQWVTFTQGSPTIVHFADDALPSGDHTLTLESFDDLSSHKSTLRTDTITVRVLDYQPTQPSEPACAVDPSTAQAIQVSLEQSPIELSVPAQTDAFQIVSYKPQLDQIEKQLGFDDQKVKECGGLTTELVPAGKASLQHSESAKTVSLVSTQKTVAGSHSDSQLVATFGSLEWQVPVQATFQPCELEQLSFKKSKVKLQYKVGASEPLTWTVPSVVKKPDCGPTFETFSLESKDSSLGVDPLDSIVSFNADEGMLTVATDEAAFAGHKIDLVFAIVHNTAAKSEKLSVTVELHGEASLAAAENDQASYSEATNEATSEVKRSSSESSNTAQAESKKTAMSEEELAFKYSVTNAILRPATEVESTILAKDASELSEIELFKPIPLGLRLSYGLDSVVQTSELQRAMLESQAMRVDRYERVPEARLSMGPGGLLTVAFTEEIKITDQIRKRFSQRQLAAEGQIDGPIQLFVLKGDKAEDGEVLRPILRDWSFKSLDSKSILLQLDFDNPSEVSQGDNPEILLVQLILGELESVNGQKFPPCIVKVQPYIRQISREKAQELLDKGSYASYAVLAGVGGVILLNQVLSLPNDKVWAMLGVLQILQHERLFNAKLPANVNAFTNSLTKVTSAQPIDFDDIINDMVYIPEREPFSLNFKSAGYDSNLILVNGQGFVLNYMATGLICLIPLPIAYYIFKKRGIYASEQSQILRFVFWNGVLRALFEGYLDMTLFALININEMEWPENMTAVAASNYFAIGILALNGLLLLLPLVFCCLGKKMANEKFRERVATLLDGTKHDQVKTALTVSFLFFMRRMVFSISVVFMDSFLWGQVAIQLAFSIANVIFLRWFRPLESSPAMKFEVMNEVVNLLLQYMMLCFTDFVPEAEMREYVGTAHMYLIIGFMATHMVLIMIPVCCRCRSRSQRCKRHGCYTCLPFCLAKLCCKPCIRRSAQQWRQSQKQKYEQSQPAEESKQQPQVDEESKQQPQADEESKQQLQLDEESQQQPQIEEESKGVEQPSVDQFSSILAQQSQKRWRKRRGKRASPTRQNHLQLGDRQMVQQQQQQLSPKPPLENHSSRLIQVQTKQTSAVQPKRVPIDDCQLLKDADDDYYIAMGRPDLRKIPINLGSRKAKPLPIKKPVPYRKAIPSLEDISEVSEDEPEAVQASGRQQLGQANKLKKIVLVDRGDIDRPDPLAHPANYPTTTKPNAEIVLGRMQGRNESQQNQNLQRPIVAAVKQKRHKAKKATEKRHK